MANVRFKPNRLAAKQLAGQPEMGEAMKVRAEHAAKASKAIAPVGPGIGGHYRDSIVVETERENGVFVSRVIARKHTAKFLEFGTEDTPTFAPLRRGAEAAGLRLGR